MTKTLVTGAARVSVRAATAADLPRLRDILNSEILTSTASWMTVAKSKSDMADWFAAREAQGFPVLVAEDPATREVAGYASYGPFRAGQGYAGTVEHSVYVQSDFRGHGIAACLMGALIGRAREAGMHLMIGGVSADQEASLRLHGKLGFQEVGRIPGAGRKFGRTLDLVFMALPLRPA
jgi:phosphinothricin acetyltransferase